tara:strand:- start:71 stop:415 length:345 start_codon:yes stop_codon:yes gene_type:complete
MKSTSIEKAPKFNPVEGATMALVGDGEQMTLVRITAQPSAVFADHSHDHEQIGTCFEGGGVLSSAGKDLVIKPGDSWVVPSNEVHKFVTGNETTIIYESWSPPREDYRKLAKLI